MSVRLTGRAAAPGAALAPAFPLAGQGLGDEELPEGPTGSVEEELDRLRSALARAEDELRRLGRDVAAAAGEEEAEIFEAHAEFAADPELRALAEEAIAQGSSAERSVVRAFGVFRDLLAASASEYLAARAADLDDVRDRVVRILLGRSTAGEAPRVRSVIVAHELTPSQTASIPPAVIAGIVTETGSPTSHAAILARALGVPAVVSCPGLLEVVEEGTEVAVDGRTGEVIAAPEPAEREAIRRRMEQEERRREELAVLRDEPGRTADGHRVELAANIGSIQHVPAAVEAGGEGSGLVRTEFLFLGRTTAPTVEEQVGFYGEVLRAFPGRRVVFRTLDVGADKPLPFVERDPEENPALGLRGIRLSLERPDLFRDQLRALLRARAAVAGEDAGRLAIMFPLVSVVRELRAARAILEEVAAEEGQDLSDVEVGVMIEVPSAALAAPRLAAHADFLSIGTNDLLQYLFAADRLVGPVADLADVLDPDVLRLIGHVVEAGHAHGAWVGVCGEAAGDPTVAAALVGLGVDELSMTRVAIPEVKDVLRGLTLDRCREAVRAAIDLAGDAVEARRILEERLGTGLRGDGAPRGAPGV
ncbi:MAG TPA: phosphoenolpyruvate--protein phosphotransferase [Actinomycetota bacterium]|nr:phosphoenolpyruvate--protein phosphotransferase [Actinomycetota bacterium]